MDTINKLRRLYLNDLDTTIKYRKRVSSIAKWNDKPAVIDVVGGNCPIEMTQDNIDRTYVWSDQHFDHDNIISFSNRPYMSTDEMNRTLIANHNDYVTADDICIWVGDVGLGSTSDTNALLDQCNGYKILVIGNHDFHHKELRTLHVDETHLIYKIESNEINIVCTHYPIYNIYAPWFNVHGHLHAYPTLHTKNPLHYNVNCEAHLYRPVALNKIISIAKMRSIARQI